MKQTHITASARQALRQRAQIILDALEAAARPETYAEIIRAARAVMVVGKMMQQLWPEDDQTETEEAAADSAPAVSRPLNRHERRAEAAQQRSAHIRRKDEQSLIKSITAEKPRRPNTLGLLAIE